MLTMTAAQARDPRYIGDFGSSQPAPRAEFGWRILEEIDFGLAMVGADGELQHANHLARDEISLGRFLRLLDGCITAAGDPLQAEKLANGLRLAGQGRRQLVMLHDGQDTLPVACVPLGDGYDPRMSQPVLLMLGRRVEAQRLAITFFARTHGLTPAEENVLRGLYAGHSVLDIARANGTTEGTVRTQVRTLRDKAGAPSIRLLLQRVAALPPVVPVSLACTRGPAAQSMG